MTASQSDILEAIKERADENGFLPYRDYIEIALYHPTAGYYKRNKIRTGRRDDSDFYTASNLGDVFKRLIISAVIELTAEDPNNYSFVEIGAEPENSLLGNNHPFSEAITYRLGDEVTIPPKSIVFSNELLDAQPFHRLIFKNGKWQEVGISIKDTNLKESISEILTPEAKTFLPMLPKEHTDGYIIDLPIDAERLLLSYLKQDWKGCLLFLDYGKSWKELIQYTPAGTGRSYYKHKQTNNLLKNPGEQDITCHICWDRLEEALAQNDFENIQTRTQESFFVNYARKEMEKIISNNRTEGINPEVQTLKELLHPAHMGQKFQVMTATR